MRALLARVAVVLNTFGRGARLACGQPDYAVYRAHVAEYHPDVEPMTYAEFFRERQAARFRADRPGRCC